MEGGESPEFAWDALVPLVVHDVKVEIIEALLWVGQPLSATDLTKLFDEPEAHYLSIVSYHAAKLAESDAVVLVRKRQVRGAEEKFYSIPHNMVKQR